MDFSSIRHFKKNKSNTSILVWKVKKTKKLDFAISFYCLNAVFSRSKKSNKKKAEELGGKLLL